MTSPGLNHGLHAPGKRFVEFLEARRSDGLPNFAVNFLGACHRRHPLGSLQMFYLGPYIFDDVEVR